MTATAELLRWWRGRGGRASTVSCERSPATPVVPPAQERIEAAHSNPTPYDPWTGLPRSDLEHRTLALDQRLLDHLAG